MAIQEGDQAANPRCSEELRREPSSTIGEIPRVDAAIGGLLAP
jgi:hypothetical protein